MYTCTKCGTECEITRSEHEDERYAADCWCDVCDDYAQGWYDNTPTTHSPAEQAGIDFIAADTDRLVDEHKDRKLREVK
jgi:hypothetical protein